MRKRQKGDDDDDDDDSDSFQAPFLFGSSAVGIKPPNFYTF
jgi:hypothetical protein